MNRVTSLESSSASFTADYQALTVGCGYVLSNDWSTVTVTGEDRHSFLHNMCTNDIRQLSPGQGCEAFFTDVKGKIVAHVFVIAGDVGTGDRQLDLVAVPGQAMCLIEHLDRYIIREDVQLRDRSSEVDWLFIAGAGADEVLAVLGATSTPDSPWQNFPLKLAGTECLIVNVNLLHSPAFWLCCPAQQTTQVEQHLATAGATKCSSAAWTTLRIESRLPLYGIDFSHTNLPQEIGRDSSAIHFNKGCYLGQETIARIDALGHVNQKIVLLQFDTADTIDAVPDTDWALAVRGKNVGRATSVCWSPQRQAPVALALVRRGSNDIGTKLESTLGTATVIAADAPVDELP